MDEGLQLLDQPRSLNHRRELRLRLRNEVCRQRGRVARVPDPERDDPRVHQLDGVLL